MEVIKVPSTPDPSRPLKASIFLAGPCPRDSGAADWRHECVELFRSRGYDGALFWPVPESNEDKTAAFSLDKQVTWETKHLKMADLILFWIPRKVDGGAFAGFTTNVEFGLYHASGKVVMGYPPDAEKMRYIAWWCDKIGALPIAEMLSDLVDLCLEKLASLGYVSKTFSCPSAVANTKPCLTSRTHGEQYIPLILWRSQAFQDWYQNQLAQGNTLLWGDVDYVFRLPGFRQGDRNFHSAFIAVLRAHIQIGRENNRVKSNEVVVFRPDVCAVVPFYVDVEGKEHSPLLSPSSPLTAKQLMENVKVVLTAEFRSPCRNLTGNYVVEPPCGSSWDHIDYDPTLSASSPTCRDRLHQVREKIAIEELIEEAGIDISNSSSSISSSSSRLIYVGSRQVASTLSSHHAHIFALKLSKDEFEKCQRHVEEKAVFGVEEDTERTWLKILSFGEILSGSSSSSSSSATSGNGLDWSSVGVISQTLMSLLAK